MIFDEADIELQAENILITNGGTLQVFSALHIRTLRFTPTIGYTAAAVYIYVLQRHLLSYHILINK